MRAKQGSLAWIVVFVCLSSLWPGLAAAQSGTTYVVRVGDSLRYIAQTYGTSVEAIMQENGLASADIIWVGQSLTIPVQAARAGSVSADSSRSDSYTVQIGDTLASIAQSLGVDPSSLAIANGMTDPDMIWVGQRLLIPGSAIGSSVPALAPANSTPGRYSVQVGDSLNDIARRLGVSPAALAQINGLTDADLLIVGQTLTIPGGNAANGQAVKSSPTPPAESLTGSGAGTYLVKPGDTLLSIAQTLGVSPDALAQANGIASADLIVLGQRLIVPVGSGSSGAGSISAGSPGTPEASATPPPTGGLGAGAATRYYTVSPGDTLHSIAQASGVSADALAQANGLTNADLLVIGQKLTLPRGALDGLSPTPGTAGDTPAQNGGGPSPTATVGPAGPIRYTVQPGDTLGSIAKKYEVTAAVIARANQVTSPDLLNVGSVLNVPGPAWTSPNVSGQASRFVASISQQRCWVYQGNNIVADWPCSTGQRGTDTQPGSYKIQSKMEKAYGSTWNIWMPYWLGIYWAGASENGIHGIPYGAKDTSWRLWDGYVGTPVTYGCVLLEDVNVKQLFDMAYIGMPVIIQP